MNPPRCRTCNTEMVAARDGALSMSVPAVVYRCPRCPDEVTTVAVPGAVFRVDEQKREEDES